MGKFRDLPADIMLEIFTRLPAESVLDCKSVSKTWKNALHHPSFSQMHSELLLSRPHSAAVSAKLSFILHILDLSEPYTKWLYYLEYDDEVCSHRLRKLNLNPPFASWYILGSCNGLICINGLPNHCIPAESGSADYVAYICNPITRECITLPELDRATYHLVLSMSCGFGYVASTKEYKVVRVYTFWKEEKVAQIEVYTLGSGKGWRDAGKISIESGSIGIQNAKFVNGFLYWDFGDLGNGKTVAFDLADEVFVGCVEFHNGTLWTRVLGGYLRGTVYGKEGKSSDIWLLKKKEDESSSWSKEFSLINTDPYTAPLALTSRGAVLCYADTKLSLYDLESSSSKMVEDFGKKIWQAVPHMNSLVSLKAFGEDNTENMVKVQ